MKVHVFDFDGTLTHRDTLLAFICHARGRLALLWGLLCYSPLLLAMKLGLADNGHTKERLFGHFFRGTLERDFDALCQDFARCHADIMRTDGMNSIRHALDSGDQVVVVSASIDRWVQPLLSRFVADDFRFKVIGTQVEVSDGHLTGRFSTPNCYGSEKVRRLEKWLAEDGILKDEGGKKPNVIAYGDSRGDKEMFAYADERYYKPFRR